MFPNLKLIGFKLLHQRIVWHQIMYHKQINKIDSIRFVKLIDFDFGVLGMTQEELQIDSCYGWK